MPKREANTGKAVIWTERSKMEVSGPSWSVAYHCFQTLNKEDRERFFELANEWHQACCEAGR